MEEVEEEAPKVYPGQVADKRNAALKGKLDTVPPASDPLVWGGTFQAQTVWRAASFDLHSTAQGLPRGQIRRWVCGQLSHSLGASVWKKEG